MSVRDDTPEVPSRIASMRIEAPAFREALESRLEDWRRADFAARLWKRDHTLWGNDPAEIADRLGWLDLPETALQLRDELEAFQREALHDGIEHVVLLGMGGSSLAPEVFQRTVGNSPGCPRLHVLDSTHPARVRAVERAVHLDHTLFVVSSKSGTTIETLSAFRYFWARLGGDPARAGQHFVAITDPGTSLERLAGERGFRRVFSAPPDVGGRFSALSVFGLVPAALIGVELGTLLESAREMARVAGPGVDPASNPALELGALLGELASGGAGGVRDKLTFLGSERLGALPDWIEQLIAESTGKDGKGILPVVGEPLRDVVDDYGADRIFVHLALGEDGGGRAADLAQDLATAGHPVIWIRFESLAELGGEFFRWEVATAAAGAVLGINPFDQPDVQLAKTRALEAMQRGGAAARVEGTVRVEPGLFEKPLDDHLAQGRHGDYVGLHAYLDPRPRILEALAKLREGIGRATGLPTTLGIGPRFLHSTGQLHKGGPNRGIFLQLVDRPLEDIPVPETDYTFGRLIAAQAAGDYEALRERGRRVLRLDLGDDPEGGLHTLVEAFGGEGEG